MGQQQRVQKSNFNYTRVNTPMRVAGPHLRGLAPGQHTSAETSQRRRAIDDTASDLIGPRFEPQSSCTDCNTLTTELTYRVTIQTRSVVKF